MADWQEFVEALHNYWCQGDGVVVVEFCGMGSFGYREVEVFHRVEIAAVR